MCSTTRKYASPLAFLFLWPVAGHPAADKTAFFHPVISESIQYNSNLFYLPSSDSNARPLQPGSSKSDLMNQLSAGLIVDYPFGRQKLLLNLLVADNRFVNNQFLNNTSTDDRISWIWEMGKQLSGDAGYNYRHSLDQSAYIQAPIKNIITSNNVFLNANYAWHPRWKVSAGANWSEYMNSNKSRQIFNYQTTMGQIGLRYLSPSENSVGIEYIFQDYDYPNRSLDLGSLIGNRYNLIENRYYINTVNALLNWKATDKIDLEGKIGYSKLQNGHLSERDFAGATWSLRLSWFATAKTQLSLLTWRGLGPSQTLYGNYVIVDGVGFMPVWTPTPKMTIKGNISYMTNDFAGTPIRDSTLPLLNSRTDTQLIAQTEAIYEPIRNTEVKLTLIANKQDSTVPSGSFLNYTVFASANWRF